MLTCHHCLCFSVLHVVVSTALKAALHDAEASLASAQAAANHTALDVTRPVKADPDAPRYDANGQTAVQGRSSGAAVSYQWHCSCGAAVVELLSSYDH